VVESGGSARWDAAQYARFKDERARPFFDLLARVPEIDVRRAVDLGCGTGELTRELLERWPEAEIWGVDSSAEMLARAQADSAPLMLHFVQEDLRTWSPPAPLDLIFSNAALQWVPDHARLLDSLAAMLEPAGALAVQVPNNRAEVAYRLLDDLLAEPAWSGRLTGDLHLPRVETPHFYEERLRSLGFQVELWETIYHHRLGGPTEIVEWLKGATMRPILSALSGPDATAFLAALTPRIASAYPGDPDGVLFPFRRLFFVARRIQGFKLSSV
jgi:trans-aconitate 2-methyltransferase